MTKNDASQIKRELVSLGFKAEIEYFKTYRDSINKYGLKEWHHVRASTAHDSQLFVSFDKAEGFIRGVEYTIQNLAKPKLF